MTSPWRTLGAGGVDPRDAADGRTDDEVVERTTIDMELRRSESNPKIACARLRC